MRYFFLFLLGGLLIFSALFSAQEGITNTQKILKFTSDPAGSDVYFKSKKLGVTPFSIKTIRSGEIVFNFKKKNYKTKKKTVQITGDERIMIHVKLKISSKKKKRKPKSFKFNFTSEPDGCTVYYYDKNIGITPFSTNINKADQYKFLFKKKRYFSKTSIVELKDKYETSVHVKLKKNKLARNTLLSGAAAGLLAGGYLYYKSKKKENRSQKTNAGEEVSGGGSGSDGIARESSEEGSSFIQPIPEIPTNVITNEIDITNVVPESGDKIVSESENLLDKIKDFFLDVFNEAIEESVSLYEKLNNYYIKITGEYHLTEETLYNDLYIEDNIVINMTNAYGEYGSDIDNGLTIKWHNSSYHNNLVTNYFTDNNDIISGKSKISKISNTVLEYNEKTKIAIQTGTPYIFKLLGRALVKSFEKDNCSVCRRAKIKQELYTSKIYSYMDRYSFEYKDNYRYSNYYFYRIDMQTAGDLYNEYIERQNIYSNQIISEINKLEKQRRNYDLPVIKKETTIDLVKLQADIYDSVEIYGDKIYSYYSNVEILIEDVYTKHLNKYILNSDEAKEKHRFYLNKIRYNTNLGSDKYKKQAWDKISNSGYYDLYIDFNPFLYTSS